MAESTTAGETTAGASWSPDAGPTNPLQPAVVYERVLPPSRAVYLARDYSNGLIPQFSSAIPPLIAHLFSQEEFAGVINSINAIFVQAETPTTAMYLKNMAVCFLGALIFACVENPYDRHMQTVDRIVADANAKLFRPRNLELLSPMRSGLRVIEIRILTDRL
eukprot:m.167741 g.167741  ORF g.167741 m.167741 type:complete len:163 (+) comp53181_c0_seq1:42-530(+)